MVSPAGGTTMRLRAIPVSARMRAERLGRMNRAAARPWPRWATYPGQGGLHDRVSGGPDRHSARLQGPPSWDTGGQWAAPVPV